MILRIGMKRFESSEMVSTIWEYVENVSGMILYEAAYCTIGVPFCISLCVGGHW